MSKTAIAKRYAKALFNVATLTEGQKVLDELKVIADVCSTPDIKSLLKSPVTPNDVKNEVFKAIFHVRPISENLKGFIGELLENGRIVYLHDVTDAFEELLNAKNSILNATFIFAQDPEPSLVAEIKAKLAQSFKKNIHEQIAVDPTIIGGFIVEMGNKRIDLSLKTEVQTL